MTQSPGIRADDVLLAVTTITFDISALEMFLPLSVGAAIYLVSREVSSDGEKLIQTLEKSGITIMQATPATWRLLIDSDWHGIENLKMLCGGEPLSHGLANRLLERGGELWNMYGPTETTIWSSIYKVTHESPQSVPIGRPILKTQFYVLKEDRQQVAAGEKGELYIGGAGVARGYLSLKRTEEKFFPNPFAQDGTRLYKTGDLVRELPDGNFEFFGRVDHQVKIHGFRIELNEVELALMEHPTIKHAAAVAYDAGEDDKRLAAYLVCREGQVLPDRTALREWLKAKLPHYMIPFLFIPMPSLPLMPNGKLDRQALPPISVPETTKIDPVVYTNPMEKIIYEFWRKVLGDFSFGLEDNFFETGGNSLLAVRLLSEIKKKLSVAIPAAVLLEHPTVKQLAELISNRDELSKYVLNSVFLIQRGSSSKQPLFCISGIYGDVISYQEVAGLINSEQPLWGLQIPGYEVMTSHTSIEGLADDLILAMRKAQPHGPYALVGFSFGAYVAFEMALKLQALNEKVSFLCMIDAYSPDAFQSFFSNIFFSYKLIRTLPRKTKIRYLRNAYIATRRSIVKDFKRIIFNWLSIII